MPPSRSASNARTTGSPVAIAALVSLAGVTAMYVAAALAARGGLGLRSTLAAGTLALALPALLLLALVPHWRPLAFGARPAGSRLALSVLLGIALWVWSVGLIHLQSAVFPPAPEYIELFRRLHAALRPSGPLDALVSVLVIAVLPAACEELLVRGIVLPALARPLGPPAAVWLSALVFAAMHLDLYRFLFTLSVGLVLGYVRVQAASLWPGVLAHLTLNGLTFAIAPFVDDPTAPSKPEPLLGAAALVVGTALVVPLVRSLRQRPQRAAH